MAINFEIPALVSTKSGVNWDFLCQKVTAAVSAR